MTPYRVVDHEVSGGVFGVSPACRVANFMINNEGVFPETPPGRDRVGGVQLTEREARERFVAARVARLATVGTTSGRPHLVPMTFAVTGDLVVHAVDHKPKSTIDLRRLRNIAANRSVCVLVDEYADDWAKLWWARADGPAEIRQQAPDLIDLLAAKYPQYQEMRPSGPVVVVHVERWTGWSAA